MQKPIVFALFGCDFLANKIHEQFNCDIGKISQHPFSDDDFRY